MKPQPQGCWWLVNHTIALHRPRLDLVSANINNHPQMGTVLFYLFAALAVSFFRQSLYIELRYVSRADGYRVNTTLPFTLFIHKQCTHKEASNKWVLNETKAPLFFLLTQIVIAVVLFLLSHIMRLIELPMALNWQLCKGLFPMVSLSVIGLRFV
jgi:hypothetical protein